MKWFLLSLLVACLGGTVAVRKESRDWGILMIATGAIGMIAKSPLPRSQSKDSCPSALAPHAVYIQKVNGAQHYTIGIPLCPKEMALIEATFNTGREDQLPSPHSVRVREDGTTQDFNHLR